MLTRHNQKSNVCVMSSLDKELYLPNKPTPLSIIMIEKITCISYLIKLEKKYDDYIDKNTQILMLYNIIEDYLELRDALTVRISKLRRETKLNYYYNRSIMEY